MICLFMSPFEQITWTCSLTLLVRTLAHLLH